MYVDCDYSRLMSIGKTIGFTREILDFTRKHLTLRVKH